MKLTNVTKKEIETKERGILNHLHHNFLQTRGEPFKISNSDTEPLLEKVAESPGACWEKLHSFTNTIFSEKVKSPQKGLVDPKQGDVTEGKWAKP